MEGRYFKCVQKFSVLLFLSNLLEKKSMMLPSDLQSIFVQHLSKLQLKFALYFLEDLFCYEWIHKPYVLPITSSFTEEEKEHYIDLTCDRSLKRKFNLVNLTNFWILLNDEYPALTKKTLQKPVPFAMSYLYEARFFAMAVTSVPFKRKKVRICEIMSGGFAVKIQQCVKKVRWFLVTFSFC